MERQASVDSSNYSVACDNCQLSQLEVEAVAAVREVAPMVKSICISEVLSRTPELIFLNVATMEGECYCVELTVRGWRICSDRTDCMYGDFRRMELHAKYFETIYSLLDHVSPGFREKFSGSLAEKLGKIAEQREDANNRENAPREP